MKCCNLEAHILRRLLNKVNRKITLGLLALVGGLTIVGSGFSAWYFNSADVKGSSSINAQVADVAEDFGKITTSDVAGLALELDQGGYENKANAEKGISFKKGMILHNEPITATYSIEEGKSLHAMNAGLTATFDCVITLKKELAEYIEFKPTFYSEAFTVVTDTVTNNSTITLSKPITFIAGKVTETYSFDISTDTDLVNKAFKYKEGKKPQNKTDFDKLYALNDTTTNVYQNALTFSYSLNVKAK